MHREIGQSNLADRGVAKNGPNVEHTQWKQFVLSDGDAHAVDRQVVQAGTLPFTEEEDVVRGCGYRRRDVVGYAQGRGEGEGEAEDVGRLDVGSQNSISGIASCVARENASLNTGLRVSD